MKRQNFTISDVSGLEGQKRLDHYNQWLMDPKRPAGSFYPGYPEEKTIRKAKVLVEPKAQKADNQVISSQQKRKVKMAKVTNLSRAIEIVKASASKADALAKMVDELKISRSNAFVYFTKATKALGSDAPKLEKGEKAPKAASKKVNPVTETPPEKIAKKVAEIDETIAKLKKMTKTEDMATAFWVGLAK